MHRTHAAPPPFPPRVIVRALAIPHPTLNGWMNEGHLAHLDAASSRPFMARAYTWNDCCALAVMKRLCDLGIGPAAASHLARTAVDAVDLHPDAIRELIYREYEDGQAHVTFNDQPHDPGAVLTLSVNLHALFAGTAERVRAAVASTHPAGAVEASCGP